MLVLLRQIGERLLSEAAAYVVLMVVASSSIAGGMAAVATHQTSSRIEATRLFPGASFAPDTLASYDRAGEQRSLALRFTGGAQLSMRDVVTTLEDGMPAISDQVLADALQDAAARQVLRAATAGRFSLSDETTEALQARLLSAGDLQRLTGTPSGAPGLAGSVVPNEQETGAPAGVVRFIGAGSASSSTSSASNISQSSSSEPVTGTPGTSIGPIAATPAPVLLTIPVIPPAGGEGTANNVAAPAPVANAAGAGASTSVNGSTGTASNNVSNSANPATEPIPGGSPAPSAPGTGGPLDPTLQTHTPTPGVAESATPTASADAASPSAMATPPRASATPHPAASTTILSVTPIASPTQGTATSTVLPTPLPSDQDGEEGAGLASVPASPTASVSSALATVAPGQAVITPSPVPATAVLATPTATSAANHTAIPDNQPPSVSVISVAPPTPSGTNGWYVWDVVVTFACSDLESGMADSGCAASGGTNNTAGTTTASSTLSTDTDGSLITGTATDRAGNQSSIQSGPYLLDKTAPSVVVSLTPMPPMAGDQLTIVVHASDHLSGVDAPPAVDVSSPATSALGPQPAMLIGCDRMFPQAGMVVACTYTYTLGSQLGTVQIDASSTDRAGNTGIGSTSIAIGTASPTATVNPSPTISPMPLPPTPTSSATSSATSIATASATSTALPTTTPTASPTPLPTLTFTATNTPLPTATPTATETPTAAPTSTEMPTATLTETPTATATETATAIPSDTPTHTPVPTSTRTPTQAPTETPTETPTASPTPTATATPTPTQIPTESPTETPTETPTVTPSPTETATATVTPTPTATSTSTPTATSTPTPTETPTETPTITPTQTATPSETPSLTETPTETPTATYTATPTRTATPTATASPSPTATPTETPTATATATTTSTATVTPTATVTATPTNTAAPTTAPTSTPTMVPGPTSLSATPVPGPQISLSWSTVSSVAGYNIYRSITNGSGHVQIAAVDGQTTTTYTDTALNSGVTYYYVVKARFADSSESAASPQASATADSTGPSVVAVQPPDDPTSAAGNEVGTNSKIRITFSEAVDTASAQSAFCLTQQTVRGCSPIDPQVSGSFSWEDDNETLVFTPSSLLTGGAEFSLTVSATVLDLAGNSIGSAFDSEFKTQFFSDTTRPYVSAHTPSGTAVAQNSTVVLTFSERMAQMPTQDAFCLSTSADCSTGRVDGVFTWNEAVNQFSFDPSGLLASATTYYVRLDGAGSDPATDLAGNRLCSTEGVQCSANPTSAYSFSFTTTTGIAPVIEWTDPANNATGVSRDTTVFRLTIGFSELMDVSSVQSALTVQDTTNNCYRWKKGRPLSGERCNASDDGSVFAGTGYSVVFDPLLDLNDNAVHQVTVDTSAVDATDGTPLSSTYTFSFTAQGTSSLRAVPKAAGVTTYVYAPGGAMTIDDEGTCQWSTSYPVEVVWDQPTGTVIKSGTTSSAGCLSLSGVALPLDASAGSHTITVREVSSPKSVSFDITVVLPDSLTLTTDDPDLQLTLGQTAVGITATLLRDGNPLVNAGIRVTLATVPLACAGGQVGPASGTLQQTDSTGKTQTNLVACSDAFTSMIVSASAGNGLTSSLEFTSYATPSPTASPTPSPTPTTAAGFAVASISTPTATPTASPTSTSPVSGASGTPTATTGPGAATATVTPIGTSSPTPTPTLTATASSSGSHTATTTPTKTATATLTLTVTASPSTATAAAATPTPTRTPTPSTTPTVTATSSSNATVTAISTSTPTPTPVPSPSPMHTPTATSTAAVVASVTATATYTTPTPSPTSTVTSTPTTALAVTPTVTPVMTATATPATSPSATPGTTVTPTSAATPSATPEQTAEPTVTPAPTATSVPALAPTPESTATVASAVTPTPLPPPASSPTATP